MSSISIAPTSFEFRRPAAVRLTRRGRIVFFLAFLATIAIVMFSLSGLADAGSPQKTRTIQVVPGQTLTKIAQSVGGNGNILDTIAEIEQMNGMSGAALQAGQHLILPVR